LNTEWEVKVKIYFRNCILCIVASTALPLEAQTVPNVTITPFSEAGVSLSLPGPTTAASFYGPFRDHPDVARLWPFSFVVTNSTNKKIVALTARWTWYDSSGQERHLTHMTDSLYLVTVPVTNPGARILVTPSFMMPESAPKAGFTGAASDIRGDAERFEKSAIVKADLDVVIFEDGLVVGPDQSQTIAQIQSRKQAADSIGRDVLNKLEHGEDPAGLLSDLAKFPVNGRQDYTGLWRNRIAASLLRSRDQKRDAEALLRIPLIVLHRNQ
jgi:hypothetical protein